MIIGDCGELAEGEEMGISHVQDDGTGDHCAYAVLAVALTHAVEDHPSDEEEDAHDAEIALKIAAELKDIGTKLFKAKDYEKAISKCTFWAYNLRF